MATEMHNLITQPNIHYSSASTVLSADRLILLGFIAMVILFLWLSQSIGHSEPYVMSSQNGKMYRLNTQTGQLALIEDETITILDMPEPTQRLFTPLHEAKHWSEYSIPDVGNIKANLSTSWRQGKLYFVFKASPFNEKIRKGLETDMFNQKRFTVNLLDKNGFVLVTFPVPLRGLTRIVDENGKPAEVVQRGNIQCSAKIYKDLENLDIEWNF
jgi:hypothetical protein